MTAPSRGISNIPRVLNGGGGGDIHPNGGSAADNSPATCRPSPGAPGLYNTMKMAFDADTQCLTSLSPPKTEEEEKQTGVQGALIIIERRDTD